MCRSSDYRTFIDPDRLKIRSFCIRFSGPQPDPSRPLPDSLTLLYLPRLSEHSLLVDGSEIRPDSPAFITLHRAVSPGSSNLYASRDRIVAGEGLRFDVYMRDERVLKGVFRKEDESSDGEGEWRLECKCTMETAEVREGTVAEVCVEAEGGVPAMSEKVEMVVRRKRKGLGFGELEEIPEEREIEEEEGDEERSNGGDCCCRCGGEMGMDGRDLTEEEMEMMAMMEPNTESVKWAVDVGIWVMCFGVGFLVSKASARSLRRMTRLL